jgi:ubiquitin-like modifier-activating enzyme ATG7
MLNIQLPDPQDYIWPSNGGSDASSYNCMGWELNARGKPGPRSVNLAPLLSSAHLAKQATDLNLKLMKWRMIPNLDLNLLSNMNVLLLGAGTLGCSVSRTLLGWGVRKFHFVDNGKVSYSNPVRQNLFEVSDCENGGKFKASAAAEALKRIAGPSIESEGHVMTIPMPGHSFSPNEEATVRKDVEQMDALVQEADVIFLLTDTRESRWLPTVMARAHNKMLINAALGLDSWLVMRHGGNNDTRLGCYFCNDVCAPENSTNNRTLDQQCTVTRPGLAPIASSMAVELMVALLHHEARQNAPAPSHNMTQMFSPIVQSSEETSALGIMPHQIRGSIVTYTMMTPTVPAFKFCTGCCDAIVHTYKSEGFDFVKKVCSSDGSFLEDIAGITAFREEAGSKLDDLEWDEDDVQEDDSL